MKTAVSVHISDVATGIAFTADSKTIGPLGAHYAQSGHRRLLSGTKTYSHSEGRWRKIGGVGARGRALRVRHGVADGIRRCPLCA